MRNTFPFPVQGYFASENGFFNKGILCAPDSAYTFFPDGKYSKDDACGVLNKIGKEAATPENYDKISTALINAFSPVIKDAKIEIGLTGGRDSRLIAACLAYQGVDAQTFTTGSPDDADVIVAEKVANILNLPHRIRTTIEKSAGEICLMDRLIGVSINTDFNVFGYDGMQASPASYNQDKIVYNGGGGELLRTVYGTDADISERSMRNRIMRHAKDFDCCSKKYTKNYHSWLEDWIDSQIRILKNPSAVIKLFSLNYRTGRWGSAIYGSLYGSISQRPFYDNEVLATLLPIESHTLASEVLYYELIKRLNPALLDVGFSSGEWRLSHAQDAYYQNLAYSLPQPYRVADTPVISSTKGDWRQNINSPVAQELKNIIHESIKRNEDLSEYINFDSILDAQPLAGSYEKGFVKLLWGSASLAVMVDIARGNINKLERRTIAIDHI